MGAILYILLVVVARATCQLCPYDIPDAERRDCHPWSNATQASCGERGCLWCEPSEAGYPWCFYNTQACPSVIPESSRVDCLPEGGDRNDCLVKHCLWCEPSAGGVPFCFEDPNTSLGGSICPADIPEGERIDCYPDMNLSEEGCLQRGCYWCSEGAWGAPMCFMPREAGYRMQGVPMETPSGWRVALQRVNTPSLFGQDIQQITLDVEFHTNQRLRMKFYDPANTRFEVPLIISGSLPKPTNPDYNVIFDNNPVFSVKVVRVSTGAVLFDTSIGGLQFADQFLQITTRLNSSSIYGFGEHEHQDFKHPQDWRRWPMWTRDQWVSDSNLYGVQPFYLNIEESHDTHAVLFLNANAQEVNIQPAPAITYRTIGGVLDIYMFLGPSPEQAVQQYLTSVGTPIMPPYWSLGFQLCRFGYNHLDNMKAAVSRMRQYDIPHEIQYGDIDYLDGRKDFTIDPVNFAGLEDYVDELKQDGTRFVTILDPAIASQEPPGTYPPLDNGNSYDVWVKNSDGVSPVEGSVWPGPTYFPDFLKPITEEYWTNECANFHQRLKYDGLWIDMNEPANFVHGSPTGCRDNRWNFPPYTPRIADNLLYQMTYCMDTQTELGDSYNTHCLYGWGMARQTLTAIRSVFPGERGMVFSRSTFPGAGQWGQHWLGDNWSTWDNLRPSIIGILEFNMFGFPYVGADICGFHLTSTEELCRRWQQLGAFYPFARNHNADGNPDQDPGMWPTVASDTRNTLLIRYRLLPYLYTLFYKAHTTGSTVVRSLLFEFTSDPNTHSIDDQFMWGAAFLITPALDQGVTSVNGYFPDARWFDYYTGAEEATRGGFTELDTPIDDINLHFRGGYIIPTQQPANSTMWSRSNSMGLIVALDDVGSAGGDLFWDDGQSLDTHISGVYFEAAYSVSDGTLSAAVVNDGYPGVSSLVMDDFVILGAGTVTTVTINGGSHGDWDQDPVTQRLTVRSAGVTVNSPFTVSWS